ncbi:phenylacetic acid degradation protein PaaN [Celeribacter persicus]|uniref:Phenylacetic acid degradation protein paaN n=1 Tax=Celeribacter persicus TaxID=1651082 RepID=A0A2T5HGK6_9RHOB|nr:phenylacetic acid degradation protein PaaN [Celeribacter persicus]PTQ70700.1 phenylacetic acid degradation protein paaN [Celeribacter persicus]
MTLFARHRALLERAVEASKTRSFWTPFPEVPSGKFYGETAREDGKNAYDSLLGYDFDLPGHPQEVRLGAEQSPWGGALGVSYPAASVETLIAASESAAQSWAEVGVEARIGALIEALVRLNGMSFLIGNATMHTTGQAFAMAFQAGGPHAQDRGLEALAAAYAEMTGTAQQAVWEKPQGKHAPIVLEKRWEIVPRGVALVIGCNTFPTWNSYPGLFASLATGNTVIVKPHPMAILPLALTVRVLREVFAEAGLPQDAVLLAADVPEAPITKALVQAPEVALIDYTGSSVFGNWIRANAHGAQVFTEETGVNSVTITGTDNFKGMCANLAFSLSLYSGQMCTSPQNIYVPKAGIETDEGHKSFDAVIEGIAEAVDALLSDEKQAAGVCGAIVNPATLERVSRARESGRVVRDSGETGIGRSATPLIVVTDPEGVAHREECFGPVAFAIPCTDAEAAIVAASDIARDKGAITAALYATDQTLIERAARAFARAGVNLSVNLTGNIFVNQSAAFSDFHVTGANPAGNASLTDTAFVASRFRRVMIRWPKTA